MGHAARTLIAGDTVYLRAGRYHERVLPLNSGEPGKPIAYAAHAGEEAVIDGATIALPAHQSGLVELEDRRHITITGLRVENAAGGEESNGILVDRCEHIVLEKNRTRNTRTSGIGVWNSRRIVVDGNEIEAACSGGIQESLSVGGTDGFDVRNNRVHGTLGGKEGICAKDGSRNGKVHGNVVFDVPAVGIYVDAWDKDTSGIEVFQNIVHATGQGIDVASEMGGRLSSVRIFDNIVYDNRSFGIVVSLNGDSKRHPVDGVTIVNNTVCENGKEWGGGIAIDNPEAKNVVIRNNIVSGNLSFQISVTPGNPVQVDHNLVDGYRGNSEDNEIRGGDDVVEGDPRFRNAASGDFRLEGGSPAIDRGSAIDAPGFDFSGRARPAGRAHDLGAFEHSPEGAPR